MKATKNLPQPEKPRLALSDMHLEIGSAGSYSITPGFEILLEFIRRPTMDNASSAALMAFSRLRALTELMTFQTHSDVCEADWEDLAGTIEMNAGIMRLAFEMVFEYAHKKSRE